MSRHSYPLCMRQLHKSLKETHHLRHWGRMQYGLFLKGIGLSLEDSLKFWRQEFSKGIGEDKVKIFLVYFYLHLKLFFVDFISLKYMLGFISCLVCLQWTNLCFFHETV